MAERIPQGVAIRVPLQAFLASDHLSPATGLTTTIVITISKNGAAYAATNAAETSHEIASGSYYADLNATDTDTVGPLFVRGAVATMDPITVIYNVVVDVAQTGDSFARIGALGAGLTGITGVTLAADQAVNATKFGGAAVTATTSVTFPAASTVATTAGTVAGIAGTTMTFDALQTAQNTTHGAGSWATATGFSTVVATDIVSGGAITTSGGIASADVKKMNGTTVLGTGAAGDLWRG